MRTIFVISAFVIVVVIIIVVVVVIIIIIITFILDKEIGFLKAY